jgi:hypothetical protein
MNKTVKKEIADVLHYFYFLSLVCVDPLPVVSLKTECAVYMSVSVHSLLG